jgi:hypothetical protein
MLIFLFGSVSITMKDKYSMVGKPIGTVDLPGIGGQRVSIEALKGSKNVVVVLLRSKL